MANLTNNSGQTFKTHITEAQDPTVTIDASSFTEALYRIFAADCTTVLVTASLTGGDIAVVSDVDDAGVTINVFETTLTKIMMDDLIVPAGQYTHSFKVTNSAGLELPPVFQNTVTVVRACD
jgi:hypoxanthine phosphoribosyltransferase